MSGAAAAAAAAPPSFFDDDDSSDDESFDPERDGKEEDVNSDAGDDDDMDDDDDDDDADAEPEAGGAAKSSKKRKKKRDRKERRRRKKKRRRKEIGSDDDGGGGGRGGDSDDDDDDDDGDDKDSDSAADDSDPVAEKERQMKKKKARMAFIDDAAEDDDEAPGGGGGGDKDGDDDDEEEDDGGDDDNNDYIRDGFVVDEADEEVLSGRKKKKKKPTGDLEDSDDDDDDNIKDSDDSDSDDDSDSNSNSGGDETKRRKKKRLQKLRDTDVLDDDDLALIQEAQGGELGADAAEDAEHIRRERAEAESRERAEATARAETIRAHDADELRKGLFDDEAGEDEDVDVDGRDRDRHTSQKPSQRSAVEVFDEDGMDDFIEDDIGDQDEIRQSARLEREQMSARAGGGGGEGGVSEAQLTEASEIFGTDYLEFMEAAQAEEEEEDVDDYDAFGTGRSKRFRERGTGIDYGVSDDEVLDDDDMADSDDDEEDLFGDDGDDDGAGDEQRAEALRLKREKRKLARAERRKQQQQKRLERRRARLRRAFEPVQLVENFCTERDDEIRAKDVPERYFDRKDIDPTKMESEASPLGSAMAEIEAGGEEEEEATWIMARVPAVASEFFSHLQSMDAENAEKKQMEIIHSIVRVLRLVKRDALEPEFIRRYRADVVTSPAVRDCLHEIMDEDAEWDRMTAARTTVEDLLEKAVMAASAIGAGGDIGEAGNEDPAEVVDKLQQQLEEAQASLDESVNEEERLTAELAALKEGQDDDDDDELFGDDDDDDDDEEKKAKKAKIPEVEAHLATTQQLLHARSTAVVSVANSLKDAEARVAALASGGSEAGPQSQMASRMCQSKLWNSSDYRDYLSSITDYRHATDVKGYLNLIGEGNDAIRAKVMGADASDADKTKRSRRFDRTFYRTCVSEGLRNICYKFVLPPFRAGIKLEDNLSSATGFVYSKELPGDDSSPHKWVPPTVPSSPQDFASELVGSGELVLLSATMGQSEADIADHPEFKDPLRGCRYVAAMELAYEPRIRRHLRSIYRNNCTVSTRPTAKGRTNIDAFHEYHGLHLIRQKPVKEHFPMDEQESERRKMGCTAEKMKEVDEEAKKQEHDSCIQYLRILKAERSGDIRVNVHLPMIGADSVDKAWFEQDDAYWNKRENQDFTCLLSEIEKVYFPPDGDTDEWNAERRKIIRLALTQFILPQFEVEIRRDLREAAVKKGTEEAAEALRKMAMEGPLRPNYMITENRFLVPTGDLKIVGFCLATEKKEASYFSAVTERGELCDHLAVPGGTRVDDDKMREKVVNFLMVNRPAAVVVGTGGGVEIRMVARKIGEIIAIATERWNNRHLQRDDEDDEDYEARVESYRQMYSGGKENEDEDDDEDEWKCNVDLVDDNVSQLFGRSVRGKKEFPDMAVNLKVATSIARHAKDPVAELAYAWSVASDAGVFGTEMLYMNIHPLQQILPKTLLLRQFERVLCNAIAQVGVDFNAACNQDHLHGLLTFVPGLGPRKASSIKQALVRIGGVIDSRKALLAKRLLGPNVYNNAVAFLRIRPSEELSKDLQPLDDTRLHPDVYNRNSWAQKIAIDALEMGENANASSSDREDMQNTALRNIMKDSRKEIQRLFDDTKKEWEAAYGPTFNVPAWDPKVMVPPESWHDKVEELDLEAFAAILEEQGNGKWYSQLLMIKWEFRLPFQDPRKPMEPLSGDSDRLFRLLTGESDQTLCPGKEVVGKIIRHSDFGSRVKLEGDVPGFIPLRNINDDHVESAEDFVTIGEVVHAIVTQVKKDHLCVDLSLRREDLNKLPSSWERPVSLPRLDNMFDTKADRKLEHEKQKEREARLSAMQLTSDRNKRSGDSMDVDGNGKSKRSGRITRRACAHPAFRNETHEVVDRELREAGDAMVGEALIRPSYRKADSLAIHWMVRPGAIRLIEVQEEDKDTDASIGNRLKIKDDEYGSIDELLGRYIAPLNDRVEETMHHRKFLDGLEDEVDTKLRTQKSQNPGGMFYNLCWDEQHPGYASLRFITSNTPKSHAVGLSPDGFVWGAKTYSSWDRLLNDFKKNPRGPHKSSSSVSSSLQDSSRPATLPPPSRPAESSRPSRWGSKSSAAPAPPAQSRWGEAPPLPPQNGGGWGAPVAASASGSRWDRPPPPAGPPPSFGGPPPPPPGPPPSFGAPPPPPGYSRPPPGAPPSARDYHRAH